MSEKISEFVVDGAVTDDSLITYVKNGQNFTVTQAEYVTLFGVTGSIVQDGAVTGTPVLDKAGTVNNIRNLEDGPGILTGTSPENGITVEHNFAQDSVGSPTFLNPTASQPTFVSLLAGNGIAVEAIDDHITIAISDIAVATSTVIINEISDFPTAVGGVITLADDTDYFLTNDMTTADRFVMGENCQIRSVGTVITTLTCTNVAAMFTCEDCNIRYRQITLAHPNGPLFAVTSSTGAGIGIVFADNVVFIGDTFGSVSCRIFSIATAGLVFTSGGLTLTATTMDVLGINSSTIILLGGTAVDLGTTIFENVALDNLFVTLAAGTTFLDGALASANITAGGNGDVMGCTFTGTGTTLNNISSSDSRWFFSGNNTITDTRTDVLLSMQANATATTIGTQSVPVLVAGTWVVELESQMTGTTAGRGTLDLNHSSKLPLLGSVTVAPVSGGSKLLGVCWAVNGTNVTNSLITANASSGVQTAIAVPWQVVMDPTDYVELWVSNETDTTDILVSSAVLRVN